MSLEHRSIDDIARGYSCDPGDDSYTCLACGEHFSEGEIYPIGERLFEASRAVIHHIEQAHPNYLSDLIGDNSKYNGLTDNQRILLGHFAGGADDKTIAKALGLSPSTVRQQRFIFREKAKQAKHYLAIYQSVFENTDRKETAIVPIHDRAKMVDDRYVTTEAEREHILATSFHSLNPLRLKQFSPKEKKKVVILGRIAEAFEPGRTYTEQEVSAILKDIFEDFATLRRYLIQYGFMERNRDGSEYRLTP